MIVEVKHIGRTHYSIHLFDLKKKKKKMMTVKFRLKSMPVVVPLHRKELFPAYKLHQNIAVAHQKETA